MTRMSWALGARCSTAATAAVTLSLLLSGCTSYTPLEQKDLQTAWAAVGGHTGNAVSGPEGILREIRDHTAYAPSGCSILAGPDVASPYALDDLDSNDPGFNGNFNSPSRTTPAPGSVLPPGTYDYLGGSRLFTTEHKAEEYFNAVAGALTTCNSVQTNYQGTVAVVAWAKGPYSTPDTITWTAGKVTGLMIRKGNIVFVAHTVSSDTPDIAIDAAKLSQAMGPS